MDQTHRSVRMDDFGDIQKRNAWLLPVYQSVDWLYSRAISPWFVGSIQFDIYSDRYYMRSDALSL